MILIELPMPEACDVCPFNYDFCWCNAFGNHDEWEKYSDDWNDNVCDRETRPEYCPLKEYEAVIPKRMHHDERASFDNYLCECKNELYYKQKYCDECGMPVKWNEID